MKKDNNDNKDQKQPDPNRLKKKSPLDNETDTAPDEFIAPNADTDQPIDGQVINDAVLRGEPTKHDDFHEDSSDKEAPKMNDGK